MVQTEDINVLVVEDDEDIRELIVLHLLRNHYTVRATGSGEEALQQLQQKQFDILVVDWMLPGMSGLDLIKVERQKPEHKQANILMVTARVEPDDIVTGLEQGADDYVTKPFEPTVLIARCQALLRRTAKNATDPTEQTDEEIITIGELNIWPERHEVKCHDSPIQLTRFEFKLLIALCKNPGIVMTRKRLIELVQGENIVVIDRTVDTHVFSLRKKLGACANVIETIRGVGYRVNT